MEKIYDIRQGKREIKKEDYPPFKSQKDLANELEISQKHLQSYKKLLTLIPELQSLIENNTLSPTVGYTVTEYHGLKNSLTDRHLLLVKE